MNEHSARLYGMISPDISWRCDIPVTHHLAIQGAADHIEAQAKRIEELERDLDWLDRKIGTFGDVDDGRTRITRLHAACHVLCHRDQIATQLESELAAQAAAKGTA